MPSPMGVKRFLQGSVRRLEVKGMTKCMFLIFVSVIVATQTPGGHLKLLHLWPGQIPPLFPGGTRAV